MLRQGRLLRGMPLALYCSPYLALSLRNYDPIEFYDRLIELLAASTSVGLTAKRLLAQGLAAFKIARIAQTSAVRHDIREMRRIRAELRRDPALRAFHEGRSSDLPSFYDRHLDQRLGRYAELLTPAERIPIHADTSTEPALVLRKPRSSELSDPVTAAKRRRDVSRSRGRIGGQRGNLVPPETSELRPRPRNRSALGKCSLERTT